MLFFAYYISTRTVDVISHRLKLRAVGMSMFLLTGLLFTVSDALARGGSGSGGFGGGGGGGGSGRGFSSGGYDGSDSSSSGGAGDFIFGLVIFGVIVLIVFLVLRARRPKAN